MHGALGLNDARLQTLYHFTVGLPVVDARVETTPPYRTLTSPKGRDDPELREFLLSMVFRWTTWTPPAPMA